MCVKDYIRENWKVKFIQMKDISPVAIESINYSVSSRPWKSIQKRPDSTSKKSDRLQSQNQQIVFNLQKYDRPFSIQYKNNQKL